MPGIFPIYIRARRKSQGEIRAEKIRDMGNLRDTIPNQEIWFMSRNFVYREFPDWSFHQPFFEFPLANWVLFFSLTIE